MRIIVCMKQVLDTRVSLQVNDSVTQEEPSPVYVTNPVDRVALQKALEMKGSLEGAEITAITAGSARAEQVLRMALASGANQAIHLIKDNTLEASDAYTTAFVLSKVCEEVGYTLILCGQMSLDTSAAQVHAFLAELLGIPRVTGVVRLEVISQKRVRLWRRLERGRRQVIECPLPALLTIDSLAGRPQYVSEFNLRQAAERQIRQLTLANMGLSQSDIGSQAFLVRVASLSSPKPRVKKTYVPDSSMSASQRMSYLLSGGIAGRKQSNLLEGTADYLASQIVEYLTKEGIEPRLKARG